MKTTLSRITIPKFSSSGEQPKGKVPSLGKPSARLTDVAQLKNDFNAGAKQGLAKGESFMTTRKRAGRHATAS